MEGLADTWRSRMVLNSNEALLGLDDTITQDYS